MPIRPEMRHLYPPPREWRAIRARILARAGDACECRGECGHEHDDGGSVDGVKRGARCGAPNRERVSRFAYDTPAGDWVDTWDTDLGAPDDFAAAVAVVIRDRKIVRVVLTISHRDHKPENNRVTNLRALCQRCHLRYDRHEHARTRKARTR